MAEGVDDHVVARSALDVVAGFVELFFLYSPAVIWRFRRWCYAAYFLGFAVRLRGGGG